ncbi:MAG: hypothetical protein LBS65_00380 [Desulfovibrio sp.]|nr:hypothetical protein [Desulfovibrio sp.]
MKFATLAAFILSALLSSGCASKYMEPVTHDAATGQLGAGQSAVVFFRDTSFGGGIQAPVAEGVAGDVAFIGIVSANTKLLHKTTPGEHVYVVGGEGSNLLFANLEPQKFYYVRVSPKMGVFKARFKFEPVSPVQGEKLQELAGDLAGCGWVTPNRLSQDWFADNKISIREKLEDALKKDREGESDRAVVNARDGIATLLQ